MAPKLAMLNQKCGRMADSSSDSNSILGCDFYNKINRYHFDYQRRNWKKNHNRGAVEACKMQSKFVQTAWLLA
jgi:hypothetical protein